MGSHMEMRRATVAAYFMLAVLTTAILAILVFEPSRVPLSYVFSAPEFRLLFLTLAGLAMGSLVMVVLVLRSKTPARIQLLLIPGGALVALAFAWGLVPALAYALGLLLLLMLRLRPSDHAA